MTNKHELPEAPASWRKYTKGVIAVAGFILSALTPIATGHGDIGVPEIVQSVVAALTAAGVIGFANKEPKA